MSTETSTDTTASDSPAVTDHGEPQQDSTTEPDTSDTPDTTDEAPADQEPDDASEPDGDQEPDDKGGDREAARYRRQLRAAEAERDRLRSQVETYHRSEVERLAGSRGLIDPSDIWASGVSLDQMLTDAGQVDPARVDRVVNDLRVSRPHWVRSAAAPASAVTSAGKPGHGDGGGTTATWKGVFDRALTGADADDL
ncbi:hypothetical protein [Mycobacterium sp. 852014-52144_SCH5372336]|uniref:hypothetical protein n=1 Tax=Mycobacterium sp. 852014-52144_SCH5372336 TaxID=1834115 RepID=UPI0007FD0D42|nr:hypothetical protein [Mycobacterium sp. 852014-52144_SCH5372336]OBB76810.1 hypothetical protein A5759_05235 [Mycobacterium sp. 852014-52144_SCH5372336]